MASCQRFDGREDCWNDISFKTTVVLGQISPITALTSVVNKTAYQNSLRRARPLNVAYLERKNWRLLHRMTWGYLTFGVLGRESMSNNYDDTPLS